MNRVIEDLLYYVRHVILANEDGEDFAVGRDYIDALCTIGVLEKVGRGKWTITEDAEEVYQQLTYLQLERPEK